MRHSTIGLRSGLLLVAALSGINCVTAQVAIEPTQVADLERELTGSSRFLRVSMYQTPFFGDVTKRLLTPVPPALVRLLDDTQGHPIAPGAVERIFPVGTNVRIAKVEFPSAWVMTERVLYTPRTLVWLYLDIAGVAKQALPTVLVLPPGIKTRDAFMAELNRHITREDPRATLEALPDLIQQAIAKKNLVSDMTAQAVEMAWGFPESKRIDFEGTVRSETWRWAEGARTAVLVDGRLSRFSEATGASSSSSP